MAARGLVSPGYGAVVSLDLKSVVSVIPAKAGDLVEQGFRFRGNDPVGN